MLGSEQACIYNIIDMNELKSIGSFPKKGHGLSLLDSGQKAQYKGLIEARPCNSWRPQHDDRKTRCASLAAEIFSFDFVSAIFS